MNRARFVNEFRPCGVSADSGLAGANAHRRAAYLRSLLLVAALCVVTSMPARAAPVGEPVTIAAIRNLEDTLTRAFNTFDAETLARMWDDEFIVVWPNGIQHDKKRRLAALKTPPSPIPQSTVESMQVKLLTDAAVAVVVAQWSTFVDGKPVTYRTCTTRVWARRGDRWTLLSAHVSELDP